MVGENLQTDLKAFSSAEDLSSIEDTSKRSLHQPRYSVLSAGSVAGGVYGQSGSHSASPAEERESTGLNLRETARRNRSVESDQTCLEGRRV